MTSFPSHNSRHLLQWLAIAMLLAGVCGCALFGGGGGEDGAGWHPKYEVEKGDTLYSIAWAHGLDYRELAAWNDIKSPYQIRVGDMLRLTAPEDFVYYPPDERTAATVRPPAKPPTPAKPPAKPAASPGAPKPSESPVFTREPDDESPAPPAVARTEPEVVPEADPSDAETDDEDLKWRWPVQGAVLRTYAPGDGSSGLDIAGTTGQQVRAASSGKVVYGGSGLQGYGLLVIVKHDDNFLSAYGYNRKLLVQQGDEVHIGQPIAEMGEGPQQKPILHFEVRRAGKTIDPMLILPAKP